ncbi:MAG: transporter substrate-binding domain-containing protein [Streptosporangiales bacterium]|nr:transporter substrate-binding domain-containing protein [Streptosporangiales bacterium]
MRFGKRWFGAFAVGAALALTMTACGGGGGGDVEVKDNASFPAGTTMAKWNEAGKIKIGVKFDQPGIGFKKPGTDTPQGFDIEIAKLIAGELGIEPDGIEWVETVSANREPFIQKGTVDLVLASYTINDERRTIVGQAGPYYVTGQQFLIAKDATWFKTNEDIKGKKVCSVTGSTSLDSVEEKYGAKPVPFGSYSECVTQLKSGSVDAVTTDGAILLGYAAEDPDELKVAGEEFTEEPYGIGYKHGDTKLCEFLNKTVKASIDDGKWATAFKDTLGKADVPEPTPPTADPCQ